ncbi:tRNA pseudouridine(55) synthase TruB [bacterium]|nr:tRNA pseudouridine(55) synthase TruB [bacterium]
MLPPGFLLIDKPVGLSSAAVVARVKRRLGLRRRDKVGHAGTLDPDATGLLVCAVGRATKLISLLGGGEKEYVGTLRLGVTTSTDDLSGEIVSEHHGELPSSDQVREALVAFRGEISQVPPDVSALKVDGERAYRRARRGEALSLPSRTVQISTFELEPLLASEEERTPREYRYRVVCSPGTYIRSLARDLGRDLGVGAAIASLRRTRSLPFSVEDATPLDAVTTESLSLWEEAFSECALLEIPLRLYERLSHGDLVRSVPFLEELYQAGGEPKKQGTHRFRVRLLGEGHSCGLLERAEGGGWRVLFFDPHPVRENVEKSTFSGEISQ